MKSRKTKFFPRIIALLLSLIMLAMFPMGAFAEEKANEKQYIKDVKLIYAESEAEAKTHLPKGYTLLEEDLNEGADVDSQVYLAYSTTTNPDEAITDIKMMTMKGGFVLSDYEEQMQDVKENVKKLANDVKMAADKFVVNYNKGTAGAKAAYLALSSFTVDEADGQNLADYILYGSPRDNFYIKFVLNAHQNILSAVLSALACALMLLTNFTLSGWRLSL